MSSVIVVLVSEASHTNKLMAAITSLLYDALEVFAQECANKLMAAITSLLYDALGVFAQECAKHYEFQKYFTILLYN